MAFGERIWEMKNRKSTRHNCTVARSLKDID